MKLLQDRRRELDLLKQRLEELRRNRGSARVEGSGSLLPRPFAPSAGPGPGPVGVPAPLPRAVQLGEMDPEQATAVRLALAPLRYLAPLSGAKPVPEPAPRADRRN